MGKRQTQHELIVARHENGNVWIGGGAYPPEIHEGVWQAAKDDSGEPSTTVTYDVYKLLFHQPLPVGACVRLTVMSELQ